MELVFNFCTQFKSCVPVHALKNIYFPNSGSTTNLTELVLFHSSRSNTVIKTVIFRVAF